MRFGTGLTLMRWSYITICKGKPALKRDDLHTGLLKLETVKPNGC